MQQNVKAKRLSILPIMYINFGGNTSLMAISSLLNRWDRFKAIYSNFINGAQYA